MTMTWFTFNFQYMKCNGNTERQNQIHLKEKLKKIFWEKQKIFGKTTWNQWKLCKHWEKGNTGNTTERQKHWQPEGKQLQFNDFVMQKCV